jgi:WD40 repeat protein
VRFVNNNGNVLVGYYGPRGPSVLAIFDSEKLDTPERITIMHNRDVISCMSVDPTNNDKAVLGFASGESQVWDLTRFKPLRNLSRCHEMPVGAATFVGGGSAALTGSTDFTLRAVCSKVGFQSLGDIFVDFIVGFGGLIFGLLFAYKSF